MAEWLVQLNGETFDLQQLVRLMHNSDPLVIEEEGQYYLKTQEFDALQEASDVRERASHLIQLMDGAAHFHFRDTKPITLGHIVRIGDDGKRHHYVFASANLTMRSMISVTGSSLEPDGSTTSPPQMNRLQQAFAVARNHQDVADAMRFFRQGDWINLYKTFEIIRDDLGGERQLIQQGWTTKKEIGSFTQIAQSRAALGDAARHASKKYIPPPELLSLEQAKALIGRLLDRWLESKV